MKATELRSKVLQFYLNTISFNIYYQANLPASGSTRAEDAVERSRQISKNLLLMKYPARSVSDSSIMLTTPLELKYSSFNKEGIVSKTGDLTNSEVRIFIYLLSF